MSTATLPEIEGQIASALEIDCASRVCSDAATFALVYRPECKCADRLASWLLCTSHLERGLQELRERFEWKCNHCGLIGFWCRPVRVEPLS